MRNRSLTILLGLVATAAALSGWIYAWQWKRTSGDLQDQLDGTAFTREEQILIDLQDQLEAALKDNDRLREALRKQAEPQPEPEPKPGE